ncbi:MAG: hypothetical protein WBX11_11135 [Thiobacillaceae bacterium]
MRRYARSSVPWLLVSWLVAWSMLLAQPCCYAVAATTPEPPSHAHWVAGPDRHAGQPDHDGCDYVARNALTTLAIDSTAHHGVDLQAAALPCLIISVPAAEVTAGTFKIDLHSQSPPAPRDLYLTTQRLRI